jgi:transcriptional regulator with XRE-family HTH domain
MTTTITTVGRLCEERGFDARQLAARSGVDEERVSAIVEDRWTPSKQDRDRIAATFGLSRDRLAWGHKALVEHLYGWGPE